MGCWNEYCWKVKAGGYKENQVKDLLQRSPGRMVENRKCRAPSGTCSFYLIRPHLNPGAWCKHPTPNEAEASEAHWKEGSLPVGTNAPCVFWKDPVLLKMQLQTSPNKPASLTATCSGDIKTRSKEAKAGKCILFLMPQFRKPIASNLSVTSRPSPRVTGPSSRAHAWWLHTASR